MSYFFVAESDFLVVSILGEPGTEPLCVVSLTVFPGTLAPPAPVPEESPDVVLGFPLHAAKANVANKHAANINFFIEIVYYQLQYINRICFPIS